MSPSDPLWLLILMPVIFVTVVIVSLVQEPAYALSILQSWASAEQLEILQHKRCFFCGAFPWWRAIQMPMIFFVIVRDQSGGERSGWVQFDRDGRGGYESDPEIIWNDSDV
jgi:hypothetical protein